MQKLAQEFVECSKPQVLRLTESQRSKLILGVGHTEMRIDGWPDDVIKEVIRLSVRNQLKLVLIGEHKPMNGVAEELGLDLKFWNSTEQDGAWITATQRKQARITIKAQEEFVRFVHEKQFGGVSFNWKDFQKNEICPDPLVWYSNLASVGVETRLKGEAFECRLDLVPKLRSALQQAHEAWTYSSDCHIGKPSVEFQVEEVTVYDIAYHPDIVRRNSGIYTSKVEATILSDLRPLLSLLPNLSNERDKLVVK